MPLETFRCDPSDDVACLKTLRYDPHDVARYPKNNLARPTRPRRIPKNVSLRPIRGRRVPQNNPSRPWRRSPVVKTFRRDPEAKRLKVPEGGRCVGGVFIRLIGSASYLTTPSNL